MSSSYIALNKRGDKLYMLAEPGDAQETGVYDVIWYGFEGSTFVLFQVETQEQAEDLLMSLAQVKHVEHGNC